jgi:hypothetical protein
MPKCETCEKEATLCALYDTGQRFFCSQECQTAQHVSIGCHAGGLMPGEREECMNAIVLKVVNWKTLLVQFLPYGSTAVEIELASFDSIDFEVDWLYRANQLKEMLEPIRIDNEKQYAVIRVDITKVVDNKPQAVVHVSHSCDFCIEHMKVHCIGPDADVVNLNKLVTFLNIDHSMSEETRGEKTAEAMQHVDGPYHGRYKKPLNLHLKKGAFTRYVKAHHYMGKQATRVPKSAINKVLHSKTASTLEKRRAAFAKAARTWHH